MSLVKKIRNEKMFIFQVVVALLFCLPIVLSAKYTVFWADDFSHCNGMQEMSGSNLFIRSIQYVKDTYMDWQGTYFAIFLQSILSPLARGGIRLLRMISLVNIMLFFYSVYYFINAVTQFINKKSFAIICFNLTIIPLFLYSQYNEILYWLSGQCSYSFPLSFALLSLGMLLRVKNSKRPKVRFALSVLIVVLAVGGSLAISGTVCFTIIIIATLEFFKEKKLSRETIVYFLFAFGGSLINAIAPGNFVRHSVIDANKISISKCLFYSFKCYIKEFERYVFDRGTTFIVFMIMAFILGMVMRLKLNKGKCAILIAEALIIPIVTVFPVVMGYSNTGYTFPVRVMFVFDFIFICSIIIGCFLIGNLIEMEISDANKKIVLIMLVGLSIFIVFEKSNNLEDYQPFIIVESLVDGSLEKTADDLINVFEQIENSDESDVIVNNPSVLGWFNISPLSDNIEDWRNLAISKYYGKNSVSFVTVSVE